VNVSKGPCITSSIPTYNINLTALGVLILALCSLVELTLALLDHLGIHRLFELFEDLREREYTRLTAGIVDYLTSSPEYGTAIVPIRYAVDMAETRATVEEYHALSFEAPSSSHTFGERSRASNATTITSPIFSKHVQRPPSSTDPCPISDSACQPRDAHLAQFPRDPLRSGRRVS
jgi:hypothetical protein